MKEALQSCLKHAPGSRARYREGHDRLPYISLLQENIDVDSPKSCRCCPVLALD